jgi:hypothetical protein
MQKYLQKENMKTEKTEIWITCDKPLEGDSRRVRDLFGKDV